MALSHGRLGLVSKITKANPGVTQCPPIYGRHSELPKQIVLHEEEGGKGHGRDKKTRKPTKDTEYFYLSDNAHTYRFCLSVGDIMLLFCSVSLDGLEAD